MTDYVKPEQMDTVQKMKYMSIVSKVCKELDTHLGFSEKSVGSSTSAEFNKKLLSNDISLEPSFTDQLYGTILYLYPKAKPSGVDGAVSKMDVASTLQQSRQYVWDVQIDRIERRL